jgi:hypothetical protein
MTFTVPARRAEILSSHVAPVAGYLNGDAGDDYVHIANRFGESTTLYADQVTQVDTTNGLIARFGYGEAGAQTWPVTITKTATTITNLVSSGSSGFPAGTVSAPGLFVTGDTNTGFYAAAGALSVAIDGVNAGTFSSAGLTVDGTILQRGPVVFDVEAYANASDLNADGTFENSTDASTAINLAAAAIRAETTGPTSGGGWTGGRVLRFNSPIYTISRTLNFTYLSSCSIVVNTPGSVANLYCGNSWAGPPVGSAGDGVITAAQSPMADCTGMANCTVVGLQLCAQTLLVGNPAPTTRPAVGWLVAATETYDGSWGGTNGDSNNNTFISCAGIGWAKYADWAFVGSVISTMHACGGQSYSNEQNSMSLYAGCVPLDTDGDPDTAGTAFDSPFYPNDGSPATDQKRMLRTEAGGTMSELVIIRSEFHDMYPTLSGVDPDVQTAKQRTMLFHRINGLKILDVPISNSGVSQIDLWGQCLNVDLEMTQNYNKGGSNARSNYFIRVMDCSDANPIKGLRWHNHMGGTAPQIGWIGSEAGAGNNAPCFFGMDVGGNVLGTSVPFFKTLGSYGGAAATVNLTNSVIDLCSTDVEFGGSIGPSVTFFNAGDSFQYSSSGGTDNSTKVGGETNGGIKTPAISFGTTPATAGHIRLPTAGTIQFRSNADSDNITGVAKDTSDNLTFGNATAASAATLAAANTVTLALGATSTFQIGGGGGGTRVFFLADGAAPSGSPSGGGWMWMEAGALKFRGSSGSNTTIAPA